MSAHFDHDAHMVWFARRNNNTQVVYMLEADELESESHGKSHTEGYGLSVFVMMQMRSTVHCRWCVQVSEW